MKGVFPKRMPHLFCSREDGRTVRGGRSWSWPRFAQRQASLYRKRALSGATGAASNRSARSADPISSALACSLRHDLMRRCSFRSSLFGQRVTIFTLAWAIRLNTQLCLPDHVRDDHRLRRHHLKPPAQGVGKALWLPRLSNRAGMNPIMRPWACSRPCMNG